MQHLKLSYLITFIMALAGCQGPGPDHSGQATALTVPSHDPPPFCTPGTPGVFTLDNTYKRNKSDKYSGWIQTTSDPVDPVMLDTDIFVPKGQTAPQGGYPVLIVQAGGGGSKTSASVQHTARLFAEDGYVTLSFTARGLKDGGSCSTGEINMVDPDKEGEDVIKVILWLKANALAQVKVPVNVKKIGMTGGSYGGLQAWIASAMKQGKLPGAQDQFRIKAIVPGATGVDLVRTMGGKMSPRTRPLNSGALKCLLKPAFIRSPVVHQWYDILDKNQVQQQHVVWNETMRRSVAQMMLCGPGPCDPLPVDLGVMIIHPWADGAFPVDASIDFFKRISAGQPAYMRKLVLADAGHPSGLATYYLEDLLHQIFNFEDSYAYKASRAFFACHLKGGDCADPSYLSKPVSYALPGEPTVHHELAALPDLQSTGTTYYLRSLGSLGVQAPMTAGKSRDLVNAWPAGETPGTMSTPKSPKEQNLVYTTGKLSSTRYLIGGGKAVLWMKSSAREFALSVRVYEVSGINRERLITRGVYWFDNSQYAGGLMKVEVPIDSMSFRFQAGRRIRVKISNIDRFIDSGSRSLLLGKIKTCATAPVIGTTKKVSLWTMPSYVDSTQTIRMDKDHASYVRLPLYSSPTP